MSEQSDVVLACNNVFLKMFRRFLPLVDCDVARHAMWATRRCWNIDAEIVLSWRFTVPANMPDGCATLARGILLGSANAFAVVRFRCLLAAREFVLPFQTKFKLGLFQSFLKTQNLPGQFRIALSFGVKLAVNVEPTVFAGVDDVHQIPNRSAAKMRASFRVTAAAFVTWIVTKLHCHSPKRNDNQLPKTGRETIQQFS